MSTSEPNSELQAQEQEDLVQAGQDFAEGEMAVQSAEGLVEGVQPGQVPETAPEHEGVEPTPTPFSEDEVEAPEKNDLPSGEQEHPTAEDQAPVATARDKAIVGDSGMYEQQPYDGSGAGQDTPLRTSPPPAALQSGVPLPEDRAAGVKAPGSSK